MFKYLNMFLLLSSSAYCSADTKGKIYTLTECYSTQTMEPIMANNAGEAVWTVNTGPHEHECYYWNKNDGAIKIRIFDDLIKLGYEPVKMSPIVTSFTYAPIFFDDMGNVFLSIIHKSSENLPSSGPQYSQTNTIIGVWNKEYGFKLLDLTGIKNIVKLSVDKNFIYAFGITLNERKSVLIKTPSMDIWNQNEYNDEPQLDIDLVTPWEEMPLGNIGSRLYALEKMLLSRETSYDEKKIISLLLEAEAAHVLDELQFIAEKAKATRDTSEKAQKEYENAMKRIENLRIYLIGLRIQPTRIFSLDLPSNNWSPRQT